MGTSVLQFKAIPSWHPKTSVLYRLHHRGGWLSAATVTSTHPPFKLRVISSDHFLRVYPSTRHWTPVNQALWKPPGKVHWPSRFDYSPDGKAADFLLSSTTAIPLALINKHDKQACDLQETRKASFFSREHSRFVIRSTSGPRRPRSKRQVIACRNIAVLMYVQHHDHILQHQAGRGEWKWQFCSPHLVLMFLGANLSCLQSTAQ